MKEKDRTKRMLRKVKTVSSSVSSAAVNIMRTSQFYTENQNQEASESSDSDARSATHSSNDSKSASNSKRVDLTDLEAKEINSF